MSVCTTSKIALVFSLSLFSSTILAQQTAPKIELLAKPCTEVSAAKIAVFFSGVIQLNGMPVSVAELSTALQDKKKVTAVCYYRERPEAEATPPQMEQVLNAVIQQRLPISFYWDAQFQKLVSFK